MNKKLVIIILTIFFFHQLLPYAAAQFKMTALPDMKVVVNDTEVYFKDAAPMITDNYRVMVPLRTIFEALGATVSWSSSSRTVRSQRADRSIEIAVGSSVAVSNQSQVFLDAPPVIHNDRIFVPLRFIGEAFGGTVSWDKYSQIANITIAGVKVKSGAMAVFFNGDELELQQPLVKRAGTTLLPLQVILEEIDDPIYRYNQETNTLTLNIYGKTMVMKINSREMTSGNEKINLSFPPTMINGEVYIPVRFIEDVFAGIVHVDEKANEMHLYFYEPNFKLNFLEKTTESSIMPINIEGVAYDGSQRLMVSDNPERLTSDTITENDVTLWHDHVTSGKQSIDHRVFGWHYNKLNKNVRIAITIENLSETNDIKIAEAKGVDKKSTRNWPIYDVGLPLAEARMGNLLSKNFIPNSVVKSGETSLIKVFHLQDDELIGFLEEFKVMKQSGRGELNYKIRTVLSQQTTTNMTTITSDPVSLDANQAHPRGSWRSSDLKIKVPEYKLGNTPAAYRISNKQSDHLFTRENSYDSENAVENYGHYGVVYKVSIPINNPSIQTQKVLIRVASRGGTYAGAINNGKGVYLIPPIEPGTEVANVGVYDVKSGKQAIELEIMHAGGAFLPLGIEIITIQ